MGISPKSARAMEICATSLMPKAESHVSACGKAFDEVGTAQSGGDHGLARIVELIDQGNLVRGDVDIALAIADAHKQSKDGDIVSVGRR